MNTVYNLDKRSQLWADYENSKEYFFTGPYSTGKTFTLLLYTNFNIKNNRKAYFNLEVLEKNAKYLEIISYESKCLFKDNKSWKNTFESINENILEKPLSIIKYLIDSVCSKDEDNKIKYTFILDQIKLEIILQIILNFKRSIRYAIRYRKQKAVF